jgi:hypothetical protein
MTQTLRSQGLLTVLAALAAACGGGAETPPAPPTQLTVVQDGTNFDWLTFNWTPPAEAVTGYQGQGRVSGGNWDDMPEQIPGDAIGGTLEVSSTLPEQVDLAFRLRSVRGSTPGPWSAEAHVRRGVRFPAGLTATVAEGQGLRLDWVNGSAVATGVRVERSLGSAPFAPLASLPASAGTFLDAAPSVGWATYRVIATATSEESLPAWVSTTGYPAAPVTGLAATAGPGGVLLTWTNPVGRIASLRVYRGPRNIMFPGDISGPLPPDATAFLDPAAPGVWLYEVEVTFADVDPATTPRPRASLTAVASPSGTLPLQARLLPLPQAYYSYSGVAPGPSDAFTLALGSSFYVPYTGPLAVAFMGTGAPPGHDLGAGHGFVSPSVALDPAGHPHAMVLRPVPQLAPLVDLVHAWHDGLAWQEEQVARAPFDAVATVRFAIGPAGELAAAWTTAGAAPEATFALRGGTGWVVEDLAALRPAGSQLAGLAFDGTGLAGVLLRDAGGTAATLLRRAGSWVAEPVPFAASGLTGLSALYPLPAGFGAIQYRGGPTCTLALVERAPAGWGAEQVLRVDPQCGILDEPDVLGARATPDGARRMAWVFPFPGTALRLHLRDGADPWTEAVAGLDGRVLGAWVGGDGRFRLVVGDVLVEGW